MKLGNDFTRHHPITHMNVVVAGNMLTNVRNFIILQSGEGLIKITVLTFLVKKQINEAFGYLFLEPGNTQTNSKSNLVLESKGL